LHNHKHGNKTTDSVKNIKIAFFLNVGFAIAELIGGIFTNSLAIASDALHDLGDSISLGLSWFLERYSKRKKDKKFSFGYRRYSLLSALINSLILTGASIYILYEAIKRLISPEPINATGMIFFAIAGIIINGIAALRVRRGKSLNERVVTLHLLEDVLGWIAVFIVAIIMFFKDIPILDPILSVIITLYILYNVFKNLKKISAIFLQAVPDGVSTEEIEEKILKIKNVKSIHHTHIWSLDSVNNIMTAHLVVKDDVDTIEIEKIRKQVKELLSPLSLEHSTIEIETEGEYCRLRDGDCFE
jgi:cobalt-zinc-cadmium efflux system protein